MVAWLDRLRGERPRKGRLPALLADYPAYRIPYPGQGWTLTLEKAEANLAYLLTSKTGRLRVIGGLLAQFDIDLQAGLAAPDPKPFLDVLWRWTADEWPAIYDPSMTGSETWLRSPRDGPEIVFSLIMDLGILLGEMVLLRRPDYGWALDLDPENRADGMRSWQRPVVLRPADTVVPTILFDFESSAHSYYMNCVSPSYGILNDFGLDALSGAHERYWREEAARRF